MTEPSENLKEIFKKLKGTAYRAVTVGNCIACGTCIRFCPLSIRVFNSEGRAITIKSEASCGGCSVCFKRCPQQAISLVKIRR